jgi:hypothetical protein
MILHLSKDVLTLLDPICYTSKSLNWISVAHTSHLSQVSQLLYNLSQMSQVGHKGVVNTVGSCYLNDDITEALETSHLLSLKEGNWSTEVKHLLTP